MTDAPTTAPTTEEPEASPAEAGTTEASPAEAGPAEAGPLAAQAIAEPTGSRRPPHARRFRLALALLGGLALVAIVVAVTAGSGGRATSDSAVPWSAWKPSDSGTQGAREIASFIAPGYRISAADPLAIITVVNLESSTAQQAAAQASADGTSAPTQSGLEVAVRPSATSSQVRLLGGNTVAYNLCGYGGKNCSIGVGKPSSERLLLLRREALELALYTFKYIDGTDNVMAILPPGHSQPASTSKQLPTSDTTARPVDIAVLFQRQELAPLLAHPLDLILPEEQPPTVAQMGRAPEATLVTQATARGMFSEKLQQAQDGSSLMVLAPLPAQ